MSKLINIVAATALLAASPAASNADAQKRVTLDDAVGHYFRGTEKGDPEEIRQGFLTGSAMYGIRADTGFHAYPIRTWRGAMAKDPKPKQGDNTNLLELKDAGRETAVVKVTAKRGDRVFTDYMLLLNYGTGWKIVSKVYANASAPKNADLAAARAPVEAKIASDADWDPTKLARSLHTRAMVYSVQEQNLVLESPAEWGARYLERQAQKVAPCVGAIDHIETSGDVGYARWQLKCTDDGSVWHDRALLIRDKGEWRILALSYSGDE
ncbi:MAG: nuclear transport factor 2 family protein [Sphingorhabdus sp.]